MTPDPIIPSVPLREAVLCSGCEAIYNINQRQCPRCSDPNGWLLHDWIRRVAWLSRPKRFRHE